MLEDYIRMPLMPASLRDEFDGYDVDLSMGEISISPEQQVVASITWASCVE